MVVCPAPGYEISNSPTVGLDKLDITLRKFCLSTLRKHRLPCRQTRTQKSATSTPESPAKMLNIHLKSYPYSFTRILGQLLQSVQARLPWRLKDQAIASCGRPCCRAVLSGEGTLQISLAAVRLPFWIGSCTIFIGQRQVTMDTTRTRLLLYIF